jgi:hypothetical protein
MPILRCPQCGSELNMPPGLAAETTACPVCHAEGLVPKVKQVGPAAGQPGRLEAVLQETITRPPQDPAAIPVPIPAWSSFWSQPEEERSRLIADLETYRRELPRLLQEGNGGRFAIIREGAVVSIWDTRNDALQAAAERFGLGVYSIQKIDARDVDRLPQLEAQARATCRP